jgi:hypothetical protein
VPPKANRITAIASKPEEVASRNPRNESLKDSVHDPDLGRILSNHPHTKAVGDTRKAKAHSKSQIRVPDQLISHSLAIEPTT